MLVSVDRLGWAVERGNCGRFGCLFLLVGWVINRDWRTNHGQVSSVVVGVR